MSQRESTAGPHAIAVDVSNGVALRPPARAGSRLLARAVVRPMDEQRSDLRSREAFARRLLAVADVLAASLALYVCLGVLGNDSVGWPVLMALPVVVVLSKVEGLYDRDELLINKTTVDEIPKLFQVATLYALVLTVVQGAVISGSLGTEQILGLWGTLLAGSFLTRCAARQVAALALSEERCLFVGSDASFARLSDKLVSGAKPCRIVGRMAILHDPAQAEVDRCVSALHREIREGGVHRVIVEPSGASPQLTLDFVREAKATGARVSVLPRILEVVGTAIEVDDVDGLTLLGVRRFGLSRSSMLIKRTFDATGAAVMLLAVAPLFAALAVLIKLDSRGPVFYCAPRVGRDGRMFRMWKFRSMVCGADEMKARLQARNQAAAGLFKIADDPRLTRAGRVIRKLSLDELPQLFNVLRGEMSLVGPRPLVFDEDAKITGLDRRRLHLTPGMTGHWQILGSSRVPLSEMVKLDYLYVAGWSLWNDVKILLRTVPYVISRRGQ